MTLALVCLGETRFQHKHPKHPTIRTPSLEQQTPLCADKGSTSGIFVGAFHHHAQAGVYTSLQMCYSRVSTSSNVYFFKCVIHAQV